MKCARLHLQERSKPVTKSEKNIAMGRPRRYCQKRMVNPDHEEDPRWIDVCERFRCLKDYNFNNSINSTHERDMEDLYLTVQTLKFDGTIEQRKRPKTSFKFKTLTDNRKHRMFVKQVIQDDCDDNDGFSDLTNYYFDDYVKYLFNNDRSRPASGKSILFLQEPNKNFKVTKSIQANIATDKNKLSTKYESKYTSSNNAEHDDIKEKNNLIHEDFIKNAKIIYNKTGKRKSLTISRAPSPETMQIIRVDVVCNNNTTTREYESKALADSIIDASRTDNAGMINIKNSHLATKYLLTNTIKTLDENLSNGSKVTLFCKTFKLVERSKILEKDKNTNKNNNHEHIKKQKCKSKINAIKKNN